MNTIDIDGLCNGVARAVEQASIGFRLDMGTAEVLDRFWCLQDQVSRLVESACDHGRETFDILERKHPGLIQDIVRLLDLAEKLHLKHAPAVRGASSAINCSLARLHSLGQQPSVMTASA